MVTMATILLLHYRALTFQDNGTFNITYTPCHVQLCGIYTNSAVSITIKGIVLGMVGL